MLVSLRIVLNISVNLLSGSTIVLVLVFHCKTAKPIQ